MKTPLILAAAAAFSAPALAAQPAADRAETSIPFVSQPRSIRSFKAPTDDLVYLKDRRGRWYRAELGSTCVGLRWANAIGYDARGGLSLSRGSSILVEGQRCMIVSLTRSEPPPRKRQTAKRPS
ncbi:MAG TPA: DUF6491 family protein [Allosphingosinicella sp.]|jgi:hypothetical protein